MTLIDFHEHCIDGEGHIKSTRTSRDYIMIFLQGNNNAHSKNGISWDNGLFLTFLKYYFTLRIEKSEVESSHGAAEQGVTVKPTGCEFDPHSKR